MMTNEKHAGHVIAEGLERLQRNQVWLARECGVSANAVTKWIRTGQISKDNAVKCAEVLHIPLNDLLTPVPNGEDSIGRTTPRLRSIVFHKVRVNESPTVLMHLDASELEIINTYRKATAESRLLIEVAVLQATIDPEKDKG